MTNKERLTNLLISAQYYAQDKADERDGLYCLNDEVEYLVENGVVTTPETGIGDLSDGYHTFNELYHHRAILFSTLCNIFKDKAWKSKKHDTGDMFDGMFIVGIETPEGQATYHYDIEPYWDMFPVKELPKAPKWDGHTPEEAIRRISTLKTENVILPPCKVGTYVYFITDVNGHCFTIRYGRVYEISITSKDNLFLSIAEYDESDNVIDEWSIPKCQWGKTVFLTHDEAIRVLEKCDSDE